MDEPLTQAQIPPPQVIRGTKSPDFNVEVLMLQKQAGIISHVADTDLSGGVCTSHK